MPINNINKPPVIFLAFANDPKQPLMNLSKELNAIESALGNIIGKKLCELVIKPFVTIEQIYTTFQDSRYKNRIAIFHYGGHADSYELLLEADNRTTEPAYSIGLLPFLARQEGLELVFLNGCSTQLQANSLIEAGIDAVIGTVVSINDEVAFKLADRFYKGLGAGLTIKNSWEDAKNELNTKIRGRSRDAFLRTNAKYDNSPLWKLNIRPGGEEVNNWNLPTAANAPLFGLPKIPATDLPEVPYRFLERYRKEDAPLFFGRGKYIRDLYHRIDRKDASPVILLTGQSGVGKSSLLEAGLFPRLEKNYSVFYIRRSPDLGLLGSLQEKFEEEIPSVSPTPFDLQLAWKQLESNNKKPLVILLDQVEEVFTRPNAQQPTELADFLKVLQSIYISSDNRPQGKLILSYRKEYHTNIKSAFSTNRIPADTLNIERITKREIQTIVNGLTSTEVLRNKYQLTIAPELPQQIADDLTKDRDTPVAPVLQIILTKLWQQQVLKNQQEGTFKKEFTQEDYNQLWNDGVLLADFFTQQMTKIRYWEKAIDQLTYNSGLALDILHYHTTDLSSAESRNLEDLRKVYQHRNDILEGLIQQFKAVYLLTNTQNNQNTALAHDLLAPIIQKAIRDSDKPGQRAKRILEAKAVEYERNEEIYLDEEDLALVEKGANGMRIWTPKETKIVHKSRERKAALVAERKRNEEFRQQSIQRRKRFWAAIFFLLLFSTIGATIAVLHFKKQAAINDLVSQARQEEREDATEALAIIKEALQLDPTHKGAIQARHDIYSYNEFYKKRIDCKAPVFDVAYSTDQKILVTASPKAVIIRALSGDKEIPLSHPAPVNTLIFSPDEQQILTGCQDGNAYLWATDGRLIRTFSTSNQWINTVAFSPDGATLLTGHQDGVLNLWNSRGKVIQSFVAHTDEVSSVAFSPSGDTILTGGLDGQISLWDKEGNKLLTQTLAAKVHSIAYAPNGQGFIVGTRDGVARYYSLTDNGSLQQTFQGHTRRINQVVFAPDGQSLFTASDDKTIKYWKLDGTLLKTYKGHEGYVHSLALSKDGEYFLSASEDKTVKYWKKDSKIRRSFPHPEPIGAMDVSNDEEYIMTGVRDEAIHLSQEIRDLAFEDEDFFETFDNPEGQAAYLWDTLGKQIQTFEGHQGGITSVAIAPDAQLFLTGSTDYTARLWDLQGATLTTFSHTNQIMEVVFSADGQQVLTASMDSTLGIWGLDGSVINMVVHPDVVSSVAYADDLIITGCYDDTIRLFNQDGTLVNAFLGDIGDLESIAISSDNQYIIAGNGGDVANVAVWKKNGNLVWKKTINFQNKTGAAQVGTVSFSSDGTLVAVVIEGYGGKVWNLDGIEIWSLEEGDIKVVRFGEGGLLISESRFIFLGRSVEYF